MRRLLLLVIVGLASCGDESSSYVGFGLGPVSVEDAGLVEDVDSGVAEVIDAGASDSGVIDSGVVDSGVVDAGALVSFAHQVKPLLTSKCASCHSFTYSNLLNGSRIVPFSPADSSVYTLSVEGNMPKRGTRLTAAELQVLFDWISQGALNN